MSQGIWILNFYCLLVSLSVLRFNAYLFCTGNKAYFPVFVLQENGHAPISKSEMGVESEDSKEAVIAVVDGRDVDVKKLLDQLDKCEKDLTVAESSLNVMKNSLSMFRSL